MTTIAYMHEETERLNNLRAQLNRARTHRRLFAESEQTEPDAAARVLAQMDAAIAALEVELGEAESPEPNPLEALRRERGPLALRLLEGDESARGELGALDARIADAERERDLEAAANAERERQAVAVSREAERRERERREAELVQVFERRQEAAREFERRIIAAAELLPAFLADEVAAYNLGVSLGRKERRMAEQLAEIVLVHLADFGLDAHSSGGALPYVRASVRPSTLLESPDQGTGELATKSGGSDDGRAPSEGVAVAACTVCGHDDRSAIDTDLAAGVTLREIANRYGVSRSALSRHRRHNGTDEPKSAA